MVRMVVQTSYYVWSCIETSRVCGSNELNELIQLRKSMAIITEAEQQHFIIRHFITYHIYIYMYNHIHVLPQIISVFLFFVLCM